MAAHRLLLVVALWSAWRPAETAAETALVVAGVVLVLAEWAWRRTGRAAGAAWTGALLSIAALLLGSALAGPDLATGLEQMALLAGGLCLAWTASRQRSPVWVNQLLAIGLAALSLWAVWQVAFGFERAWGEVPDLPEELRIPVAERLAGGRAFASLPFPGHLAAILATALPLLVGAVGRSPMGIACGFGVGLCGVGLYLSRSPIGVALAVVAAAVVLLRRRALLAVAGVGLLAMLVAVVVARPDVRKLEPVELRVDNWGTALWMWSHAPLTGVGFGGFGLSAQSVPGEVGNRPAHAHCLPLEWAAELGLPGCLAAAAAGVWLLRLLCDLWQRRPDLAAALAVVPLHNLVDFSCYVSAVALPWAVLAGWAVAETRKQQLRRECDTGRQALVVAAAMALAVAALHGTSVVVERFAAGEPDPVSRFEAAQTAHRLAPWRVQPLGSLAGAALDSGDRSLLEKVETELERMRFLRSGSAGLAELRGEVALALGRVPTAAAELALAASLRPADGRLAASVDALTAGLSTARSDRGP